MWQKQFGSWRAWGIGKGEVHQVTGSVDPSLVLTNVTGYSSTITRAIFFPGRGQAETPRREQQESWFKATFSCPLWSSWWSLENFCNRRRKRFQWWPVGERDRLTWNQRRPGYLLLLLVIEQDKIPAWKTYNFIRSRGACLPSWVRWTRTVPSRGRRWQRLWSSQSWWNWTS